MSNIKFSKPLWHLIDARGKVVGRLATQISQVIRGKHKPTYTPNYDCGDYVVVINAKHVKLTGKKMTDKQYAWHTGWPGGIRHTNPQTLLDKKPEEVLRKAVLGMCPKNRLRKMAASKLRIFPGENHLHTDILGDSKPINS